MTAKNGVYYDYYYCISCFHNEYEDDDDEIISDGDITYMNI